MKSYLKIALVTVGFGAALSVAHQLWHWRLPSDTEFLAFFILVIAGVEGEQLKKQLERIEEKLDTLSRAK